MSLQTAERNINPSKRYGNITHQSDMRAIALYMRLSSDDGNSGDSDSIINQCQMLATYAHDNNFTNVIEFVDDGYSGANYDNRPAFQQMLSLIESGKIGTVVCKEFSRP